MSFGVAVHPHIQVILSFSYLLLSLSYFEGAVQVPRFEQGVEKQDIWFFCIPVLPTEKPICNFYIFGGWQVLVRKVKILIIPRIISCFISRTQITQLHFFLQLMCFDGQLESWVEQIISKCHGDWLCELTLGSPTSLQWDVPIYHVRL